VRAHEGYGPQAFAAAYRCVRALRCSPTLRRVPPPLAAGHRGDYSAIERRSHLRAGLAQARSARAGALELDRRSDELEQRRIALASAGQRRQVLERLKDRKRQAHHVETVRRDAVTLDEIAMTGHVRRLAS
jgi:hypothetical protein